MPTEIPDHSNNHFIGDRPDYEGPQLPVTILDIAISRGVKEDKKGYIDENEFYRIGLQMTGGCINCHASLAAYNAYPSKSGYWKCSDCIGDDGFNTVEEFEKRFWGKSIDFPGDN